MRNNSGELTDKYRVEIAISDGVYAVWCKMTKKTQALPKYGTLQARNFDIISNKKQQI